MGAVFPIICMNYKGQLQELCVAEDWSLPKYTVSSTQTIRCTLCANGYEFVVEAEIWKSHKEAEQYASEVALFFLSDMKYAEGVNVVTRDLNVRVSIQKIKQ